MKIVWRTDEARCPFCDSEIYALAVYDIMKNGGKCTNCGKFIEKDD